MNKNFFNRIKVNFNDAGLYAVFVSEILGQFSDGWWENSRNRDYPHYSSEETFLGDSSIEKAPIRYNINAFFNGCVKFDIVDIINRVLSVYDHREMIERAYAISKEEADLLSYVIRRASSHYIEYLKENEGIYKDKIDLIMKYFGSYDLYYNSCVRDVITPDDIKRFKKIGREINANFNHSRNAWYGY